MLFVLREKLHELHPNPLVTCTSSLFVVVDILERRTFRWLGKLPIVEISHLPSDFHQNSFHAIVAIPVSQNREFAWVDLSVHLGDEWEIHPRQELDDWWFVGILLATVDLETVNAILVYSMPRTNDRPIPVAHHDIVRIIEAVRTRAIPDPLLALLELFQELKVSWYLGWHMCDLIVI